MPPVTPEVPSSPEPAENSASSAPVFEGDPAAAPLSAARVRPSRAAGAPAPAAAPAAEPAATPAPEPAAERAAEAAPRTGRIQVPVPSVVRARERGRLAEQNPVVLSTEMLTKTYGPVVAANEVSLQVHAGSFTGVVGPNGAGKTTTLSMISGLLRPTSGRVTVSGVDVWTDGPAAKRLIGSLPDRLRLFDRLTGAQLLYYSGVLAGVDEAAVAKRSAELAEAFGLESALGRLVSDYSAGMQKKIALACAMIHAPEVLVLDEPFETIDPVSAANVTEILEKYVAGGGSVVMSSHSLDLIQRVCDHVSIIVDGSVIAQGTVDAVRDGLSLEERFTKLTGMSDTQKGLEWLHGSSDSE
ncbi:ATP-binding cassette domain-containing protein [Leucobacter chromiireducens]|uniref:ABC transporter ATP-binding protein n=1 Tax=Leucobacter chromiireducens subsp. chromiireducens TaxID=660067 RepID=A0ABS1SPE3_9MICO|nr:ABC transporter ATP-binding protein [Leucobacter chromiireducens subsp. chromiireducens]